MDEIRDVIRQALEQGFRVDRTSKGHWMFFPPDKTKAPVVFSGTPSDHRSWRNSLQRLIRAGFDPDKGKGKGRT